MSLDRARLETAYTAFLRRRGKRAAAIAQLQAAAGRLAALGARAYLKRCNRESLSLHKEIGE